MSPCVFVGPSLKITEVPEGLTVYPPAMLGSIFLAVERGHRRIGLIDGFFGNVPSVWHKEILYALQRGVEVYGAASMGALRAAELHRFGMRGVGAVYRLYRRGSLIDDGEVSLVHSTAELGLQPLSLTLIDVRASLRKLRRAGILDHEDEKKACAKLSALHFAYRSWSAYVDAVSPLLKQPSNENALKSSFFDMKRRDARILCFRLLNDAMAPPELPEPFAMTKFWRTQFEKQLEDLPSLEPRRVGPPSRSVGEVPLRPAAEGERA